MLTSNDTDTGLTSLPFIKDDPEWMPNNHLGSRGRRCFWSVKTTGEVQADCELGSAYARAALDHMIETDLNPLLGWITVSMGESRAYDSDAKMIFVGFLGEIARLAMLGRHVCNALEETQPGGMVVIYPGSVMIAGNEIDYGIPLPEPMPEIEIRTPMGAGARRAMAKRGAAS
jgi:hypothetical protein